MDATIPADLRAAFEAYEAAIVANDLDALDAFFAPGPDTLRGDTGGLLVGHDAIRAFRSARGGVAPRRTARLEARRLAPGTWLLVGVSAYAGGGSGLQTQVWTDDDGTWRVLAAHVTGRPAARASNSAS